MPESKQYSASPACVIVPEDMTIYQATAMRDQLCEALARVDELELDLSKVGEIDSAGLQVLIHLRERASEHGKKLRMSNHSNAVIEVLELFNMEAYFGDPLVLTAATGRA